MNLAVRLYSHVDAAHKPDGIPDVWPAEVRELGSSTTLPGEDWILMTTSDYAAYIAANKSTYDAWLTSIQAANAPQQTVEKRIQDAMKFGHQMILEFAAGNVLRGLTVDQVKIVATQYAEIQQLLQSGSLYVALNEISALTPTDLVPQSILDYFRNKLQDYLGLPRT